MDPDTLFLVYMFSYLAAAILTAGIMFGLRLHKKGSNFWSEETMVFISMLWPVIIPVFGPYYLGREIGRFFDR
jgi:hypothetical protein